LLNLATENLFNAAKKDCLASLGHGHALNDPDIGIDARNSDCETPLMVAAKEGAGRIVKALLTRLMTYGLPDADTKIVLNDAGNEADLEPFSDDDARALPILPVTAADLAERAGFVALKDAINAYDKQLPIDWDRVISECDAVKAAKEAAASIGLGH
jgi:ankyrin repeat protein